MLFDENQHHGGAKYCFDKTHGHHVPAYIFAGDALLAKEFIEIKNKINPEYIFAGEGNYDTEFEEYNVSYFRVDLKHIPIHRYIAPKEEMMIAVSGYNDRNMINTALLYRSVFVDGKNYDKYSLYKDANSGKRAIVISNFNYGKIIEVKIKFDENFDKLYSASPDEPSEILSAGMESIPPNSVIIVFKK